MKLGFASDHRGFKLKSALIEYFEKLGYQIYENIDEVIEKYIPHKSLARRRNQTNKKTN